MPRPSLALLLALVTWIAGPAAAADPMSLFDGRTFAGWEGDVEGVWKIVDGTIVAGSPDVRQEHNDFLCTKRQFANFELRLAIKLEGSDGFVNSGIQFRSARIPNNHEVKGYQADFGAGYEGALYDESRRNRILAKPAADVIAKAYKPGAWNDYRIRAEGSRIRLFLNGIQTVDYTEIEPDIATSGVIGLQIHGNAKVRVSFKDIVIEELP